MTTVQLPITLASAAAAALINLWIATRAIGARRASGIVDGDGGNAAMAARMRAHANYVEYTPFVLILIGVIEINIGSPIWLSVVSALYLLARIAHPLGMDGLRGARTLGTIVTLTTLLGLGVFAAVLPFVAGATTTPRAEAGSGPRG